MRIIHRIYLLFALYSSHFVTQFYFVSFHRIFLCSVRKMENKKTSIVFVTNPSISNHIFNYNICIIYRIYIYSLFYILHILLRGFISFPSIASLMKIKAQHHPERDNRMHQRAFRLEKCSPSLSNLWP